MKRKFSLLLFLMATVFFASACSDDDDDKKDHSYRPNAAVEATFQQMFANATNVLWSEKDDYGIANFLNNNTQTVAWFNQQGVWFLTETSVPTNAIPKVIADAIANGAYKNWKVTDASHLDRKDMVPAYVIEVTSNGKVEDLYYAEDGYLFETIEQDHTGNEAQPTPVDQTVMAMVKQQYPSAKIVEIEKDDNYEITLVDNGTYFDYILSKDYKWIQSEYAETWANTPQPVKDAIQKGGYAINEQYDTVTKLIRPQATVSDTITLYRINIHNNTGEDTLYYTPDGVKVNE